MKLEVYKRNFEESATIVGPELPHGFGTTDKLYPCLHVSLGGHGYIEDYISESDDFWSDAEMSKNPKFIGFVYEEAGGRDEVVKALDRLVQKWEREA